MLLHFLDIVLQSLTNEGLKVMTDDEVWNFVVGQAPPSLRAQRSNLPD
ncbi:MAG: hypothetical protein JNL70_15120 [Saprospiraceae bacterium]|nr:hypothetical protein [Saprospiraceae bacterium]